MGDERETQVKRFVRCALLALASVLVSGAGPTTSCTASGELVFYTSLLERDVKALVNAFSSRCPSVELEWVRASTDRLLEMIDVGLAEGQVHADIIMLSDTLHMSPLKQHGHLERIDDVHVADLEPGSFDPGRTFFGVMFATSVIVAPETARTIPGSWQEFERMPDLADAAIPDATRSIAGLNHLMAMLGDNGPGWQHFEALGRAGVVPRDGAGAALAAVAAGDAPVGVSLDFLALRARRDGAPIRIAFPVDGAPAKTWSIAIMKDTVHMTAAQEFVRFVLSVPAQTLLREHGFLPVNTAVETPEGFPARGEIDLLTIDAGEATRAAAQATSRYRAIFAPATIN